LWRSPERQSRSLLGQIGGVLGLQERCIRPFWLGVIVTGAAFLDAGGHISLAIERRAAPPSRVMNSRLFGLSNFIRCP
jgi:hypothetical protein